MPPFPISATGGAAGPSESRLFGGASSFDASNWTVSTGGGKSVGNVDLQQLALIAGVAVIALVLVWKLAK